MVLERQGERETVVGVVDLPGPRRDLLQLGETLYVARDTDGVTVFAASGRRLKELFTFAAGHPTIELWLDGRSLVLYLADRSALAYDVTDPRRPVFLREFEAREARRPAPPRPAPPPALPAVAAPTRPPPPVLPPDTRPAEAEAQPVSARYSFRLVGSRIVVLDGGEQGAAVGEVPSSSPVHALERRGDTLFVARGTGGVTVLDVHNVTQPAELITLAAAERVYGLVLRGTRLFVAFSGRSATYDVSDPRSPRLLSALDARDALRSAASQRESVAAVRPTSRTSKAEARRMMIAGGAVLGTFSAIGFLVAGLAQDCRWALPVAGPIWAGAGYIEDGARCSMQSGSVFCGFGAAAGFGSILVGLAQGTGATLLAAGVVLAPGRSQRMVLLPYATLHEGGVAARLSF